MADLSFRATIKPLEVEEIVDLLVHRPVAHLIARGSYSTPITPDQLTWTSMFVGLASGACAWRSFLTGHPMMGWAGALLILSAVVDCADGQLARMRRSSSTFGRMLDGAVDAVVQLAVVPATVAHVWWRHGGPGPASLGGHPAWEAPAWLALAAVAVASGVAHTGMYDIFKNVYLHHTQPQRKEGDDEEDFDAARQRAQARGMSLVDRFRFGAYRQHLDLERALRRAADPTVPARFRDMAPYSDEGAARYRALHRSVMRAWSFYGVGTHIFWLGLAMMTDRVEWYLALRAVALNAALWGWVIPAQRRASRAFFGGAS